MESVDIDTRIWPHHNFVAEQFEKWDSSREYNERNWRHERKWRLKWRLTWWWIPYFGHHRYLRHKYFVDDDRYHGWDENWERTTWELSDDKHTAEEVSLEQQRTTAGQGQLSQSFQTRSRVSSLQDFTYFAILRTWLKDCDHHSQCNKSGKFLPTRLIDVGDLGSSDLKLVETRVGLSRNVSYIALSHCWGCPSNDDKKSICTTQDNCRRRLAGFKIDELPNTFRDAVYVTQSLGKRYIWIDALCILQSAEGAENKDWDKEARRMEQVFSSAYCTIAVHSARGWMDGFLRRASPKFTETTEQGSHIRNSKDHFLEDVGQSVLSRRAWVLQERVLSRRIIHFTERSTYFECGDGVRCENFTKLTVPLQKQYFLMDPTFPERLLKTGYRHSLDFTKFLFKEYAQAGLTKETDREIALSGLITRMESAFDTTCRYGIVKSFIHSLLLWRVRESKSDEVVDVINPSLSLPSWSWMTHPHIEFLDHGQVLVPPETALRFGFEKNVLLVEVREMQSCTIEPRDGHILLKEDTNEVVGKLWFDIKDYDQPWHCVILASQSMSIPDKTYLYILIVGKRDTDHQYERVGVGRIMARFVSSEYVEGSLV